MTIYEAFKKNGRLVGQTEFVKIYNVDFGGEEYKVIITKRIATKNTVIHCTNDSIAWEQVPTIPRLAGQWDGERIPIYKFNDKHNVIFVVKGRPGSFVGLDEGFFRCANNFNKESINVMSYRRFKSI